MKIKILSSFFIFSVVLCGVDKVITPDNIGEMLKAGGGTITTDTPKSPKYIEITGMTSFNSPNENITVNFSHVDVQLAITTNAFNTTVFQRKYNNSNVCISLDWGPYSCWSMFHMKRHPRFANVPDGWHFFETYLIDPINRTFADLSYSNSTFKVKKFNETELEAYQKQLMEEALNRSKHENKTEESTPLVEEEEEFDDSPVSLPFVSIDWPIENATLNRTFEVHLQVITTSNIKKFKKVFDPAFMCLSLDEAPYTCWPLFEEDYHPKFAMVEPGWHNLSAQITHPNSGELVFGTGLGIRKFYVQNISEEGQLILPWMFELEEPKPEEKENSTCDTSLEEYDEDEWDDFEMDRQMRIHRRLKPGMQKRRIRRGLYGYDEVPPSTQPITVYNYNYGPDKTDKKVDEVEERNETKDFAINDVENVDEIVLHLSVGGETTDLRVAKEDNFEKKALNFCYKHQITEPSCVPSLIKEMNLHWDQKL
eukprot:snap_masked-scaffold_22-processed-gene-4.16-mRNA-1 protein AED:1.00 eAED:1.00 QI:0/-1/0/0/-1/1/1/0/480